jgi:hypothetical protein
MARWELRAHKKGMIHLMTQKLVFLGALMILALGTAASSDSTRIVSIIGKNVDTGDKKAFGLVLNISDSTWTESEPGSDTHFFKTKKGTWVRVANVG